MHACLYVNLGPVGRHLVDADVSTRLISPRAAWVVGPHADPLFVAKETADCDIIGVRLRAGIVPRVLRVHAAELTGRMIDLDLLWGRAAVERLRTRLSSERDPVRRLRMLREEIEQRAGVCAAEGEQIRQLCSAVAEVPGGSIRSIAQRFNLSHRRVIQIFDAHVGLKPKAFQRVSRLRLTLERLAGERSPSLARVAYEAGYSDQSHLANEFRRLTGLTLSDYSRTRSPVDEGFVAHVRAPG
jgi:AraC-like DNA-binding protein